MENNKAPAWLELLMSFLFFGSGIAIVLLSVGIIPLEDSAFNAPRWVVGVIGGLFAIAGIMIFSKGRWEWMNTLFMFLLLSCFCAAFGWIAFFGDAEGFSLNGQSGLNGLGVFVARFMFGGFAVLCGLLVLGAIISPIIKLIKRKG